MLICVSCRLPECLLSCFEELLKPNYIHALTFDKPIVLGDLNSNILNDCSESRALADFAKEINVTQVISSPTGITDTSQTLIDMILISSPDRLRDSGVINSLTSDHLPDYAVFKLKVPMPSSCYVTVRSYNNYDPSLFMVDLVNKSD